jgi:predicted metalloprotease
MVRLGGEDPSSNFEDRTGQGGGFGLGGGGGGGNLLGCLLPMVMSRFGIVGVLILLVGYCALTQLGGGGGLIPSSPTTSAPSGGKSTLDPNMRDFLTRTLGSTEETWGEIFAKNGAKYVPTRMVAYTGGTQTACGTGQAAMGPFYCPNDKHIYLDTSFFNELSRRFQAPGDFAMAYVVAHEVGHHVQGLMGTLDQAHNAQARSSETQGNAIQVGVELQADCYAGVWAKNAKNSRGESVMEQGDLEEGIRAAEAIGDDTLQRQTQGTVVPDSFTHGSSAQRVEALQRGYASGDPSVCKF